MKQGKGKYSNIILKEKICKNEETESRVKNKKK
jgi:hypothetical protein